MTAQRPLPLGMTTAAWLNQATLSEALQRMEAAGLTSFELAAVHPHVGDLTDRREREAARRAVGRTSMSPISVNPTFVDVNLVSVDPLFRRTSVQRMQTHIELAAEVGAPRVILMAGRRHALCPAPDEQVRGWLDGALDVLLPMAEQHSVVLSLENSPYGYMGSAEELASVVQARADRHLRVTYDVANALAVEDPAHGIAVLHRHLELAHVSDSWKHRWAHTSPGRGEVDFVAFAQALDESGFAGPTVYELIDNEPVQPRLGPDLANLEGAGWSRASSAP